MLCMYRLLEEYSFVIALNECTFFAQHSGVCGFQIGQTVLEKRVLVPQMFVIADSTVQLASAM